MPELREVFEMTTKQIEPGVDSWNEQEKRQRKANRNKKVGAFAVAAAIGLAAVALILGTRPGEDATTPADESPTVAPGTVSGPFFLDLRTGEKTPLAKNLAGGLAYVPSPHGTKLAYGRSNGGGCVGSDVMTVTDIDGTNARTLESPNGLTICGARWSPDGTKLVYQERNGAAPYSVGNLFVHDLSSGRRIQITDLELSRAWWWFLSPSFSPNGRNVLFHLPRDSSETTKWDVWSVPVTGGEPTLELRNASFPMLSAVPIQPNEVRIAFVSPWPDDFAGQSITTARLLPPPDTADLRETLVEANDSIWWPTMSPDGSRIAYQDGGSIYVFEFSKVAGLGPGESSKVADGNTAEWLDNDTLIVAP